MNVHIPGLLVTGTDTGVGKTVVAAAIARALHESGRRVGVLKPVVSGIELRADGWVSEDVDRLRSSIGEDVAAERVAPLRYIEPLAPSIAARREGCALRLETLLVATSNALDWWRDDYRAEIVVVEGVGGLLCPVAEEATVADLAVALEFPLVIVARRALGTLNHTLLTVEAALSRSLRVAGIVLNSPEPETGSMAEQTNADELSRFLPDGIPILGTLHHSSESRLQGTGLSLDWYERASRPRFLVPG